MKDDEKEFECFKEMWSGDKKESYFINCTSNDITFCASDCTNTKCSRNLKSKVYARAYKDWVAMSELSKICTDYKK